MLNRTHAQIAVIMAVLAAICPAAEQAGESVSVIPQPVSMEVNDGNFEIGPETRVAAENEAAAEAAKLTPWPRRWDSSWVWPMPRSGEGAR